MNEQHPRITQILLSGPIKDERATQIAQVALYEDESVVTTLKVFIDGERQITPIITLDLRTDDERADLDE